MKFAYYPGCSLHSTAAEYDLSFRKVCEVLQIELAEIEEWVCCGTTAAHATSNLLSKALPAKSISLAQKSGASEIAVPCASCFSRLKHTMHEVRTDQGVKELVEEIIGSKLPDDMEVSHPLQIFARPNFLAQIKEKTCRPLDQLKVVCYYGCLLTRPPKVTQWEHPEYPTSMDEVLRAVGVRTLDWNYKTDCCGASLALTKTEVVLKLSKEILDDATALGAEAIAVACPLCHNNLDTRQVEINAHYKTNYKLPIFYFTQLMGIAFGLDPKQLGLKKHLTNPIPLLKAKGYQGGC